MLQASAARAHLRKLADDNTPLRFAVETRCLLQPYLDALKDYDLLSKVIRAETGTALLATLQAVTPENAGKRQELVQAYFLQSAEKQMAAHPPGSAAGKRVRNELLFTAAGKVHLYLQLQYYTFNFNHFFTLFNINFKSYSTLCFQLQPCGCPLQLQKCSFNFKLQPCFTRFNFNILLDRASNAGCGPSLTAARTKTPRMTTARLRWRRLPTRSLLKYSY
jgi:hypothetical protein